MALTDYAEPVSLKRLIAMVWSSASNNHLQGKQLRMPLRKGGKYRFAAGIMRAASGFSRNPNSQAAVSIIAQLGLAISQSLATHAEATAWNVTNWLVKEAGLTRRGSVTDWRDDYYRSLRRQQVTEMVQSITNHWT